MHYIEQCLEPKRIFNYIDTILYKSTNISNNSCPKQAGMIELQLTDKCNLNCFHCHFRNQGDVFFKKEWLDTLLNDISPCAISLAGGGEPTLYPDFDKTINLLKNANSKPQIGLITNGVFIPPGNWPELLSWLRVSLYSIIDNQYAGRSSSIQQKVLNNINIYMNMSSLKMLGVSLLYYNGNTQDCIRLSYILYRMLKNSSRKIENFNIQFKRAFTLSDPRNLNKLTHLNNIELTPTQNELWAAIKYKEELCNNDLDFKIFLNTCSNIEQIIQLINNRETIIAQTNPTIITPNKFQNCYAVLENRLITPNGYVYPCPSLAENREDRLALGHVLDDNSVFAKNLIKYYTCDSAWCNTRFCRHSQHNNFIQQYLETGTIPIREACVKNDYFF